MINFIADNDIWAVFTDGSTAYLVYTLQGGQFTSSYECEFFDNENDAKERATELGWIDPFLEIEWQ